MVADHPTVLIAVEGVARWADARAHRGGVRSEFRALPYAGFDANSEENPSSEVAVWEPGKPSQNENEYFARQDAEWLKANRARLDAERLAKDQASTGMKCPRCAGDLGERLYHNVHIDVCNTCRGVWLDRGELHMLAHVEATAMLHVIHEIDTGTT